MKLRINRLYVCGLLSLLLCSLVHAVNNPIQASVSSSIIRYNGLYYAMSTEADGCILQSDNMIDWTNSVQVIPPGITGPFDLTVRNGLVHLFAQDAGYAYSKTPDTPFSEFRSRGRKRQDTRLFQDKNGALLCVMREDSARNMDNVDKTGEISIQRYKTPWKPFGTPRSMIEVRLGMWDTIDGTGLSMPELINYRGNYHLLYAANDPDPLIGERGIGLAANDELLRFKKEDVRPSITVARNVERLTRNYKALLPSGKYTKWRGRYTVEIPEKDWNLRGIKTSKWHSGYGGFGSPDEIKNDEKKIKLRQVRTTWDKPRIWVRREFDLEDGFPKTPVLNLFHGGAVQVFINGLKIYESTQSSSTYINIKVPKKALSVFKPEDNVLAVNAVADSKDGYQFLDFGLYDAGDHPVEPTVYGPDAPRIVTGPNGFEKWLAYSAYWNGHYGLGLDRVFFHENRLEVDGPTTTNTSAYHPAPARPTYHDDFNDDKGWDFRRGRWAITNGVIRQSASKGIARAYLKQKTASHYLFETNFRVSQKERGKVGVVAWSNGKRDLIIWVCPAEHAWGYSIEPGRLKTKRFKLPKQFSFLESPPGIRTSLAPWHRLRITKNGGYFDVMLDEFQLTAGKPIVTEINSVSIPGLYCNNSGAEFDGVTYTIGWDEYGKYITGWDSVADGTSSGGQWRHDRENGLEQRKRSDHARIFKGDLLDQYEFTVNARTDGLKEGRGRLYGIFPIFSDKHNYLKAMIDARNRQLVVSGMRNGKSIGPFTASLARSISSGFVYNEDDEGSYLINNVIPSSWIYRVPSHSVISSIQIRWLEGLYDPFKGKLKIPMDEKIIRYDKLVVKPDYIAHWEDFLDADTPKPKKQLPGILNVIDIREVEGNHIGVGTGEYILIIVNAETGEFIKEYEDGDELRDNERLEEIPAEADDYSRPQETLVHVEVESSYFFRCVKLKDRTMIELNGQPMLTVEGNWPPSRVGLVTEGQKCWFNGITLMHLPE